MRVPLLDLKAQLDNLEEDIVNAVNRVVQSTRYIQGPEVTGLEQEVAEYTGTHRAVGVSSGTDALLISLMALDIKPGDEVLTSPYSFFATMGVILRLGARPVFADIDPVSFNISPDAVAKALAADKNKRIKAIIPVHLYGQCADMSPILAIAREHGVNVIEDAAQAIGAEYPITQDDNVCWSKAGAMGDSGCFSFFPSKNLGGIGDGGMVTCQDDAFADKIELMRNHGAEPKYYHSLVGGNFRLDAIQAAVLRVKLPHLDHWHRQRRENAAVYKTLLQDSGLLDRGIVQTPEAVYSGQVTSGQTVDHIYNQYVLRVKDRDGLKNWLLENDIGCEIYYPVPLHKQECLGSERHQWQMPHAEKAADETIAIPVYPELTEDMQAHVVETIKRFYQ